MTRSSNPFAQLASLGEEVLGKATQNPAAARLLQGAVQLKDRVDDLTKRVRGLEAMEKRIGELEQRVATLEHSPKPPAPRKPPAAKASPPPPPKPAPPEPAA